eukprot:jgi/Orpsp1_1/1187105/evm.model.d7180000055460.1
MKIINSLSLLLISSKALLTDAVPVLFKVLAINGTPTININYQQYEMEPVPDSYPLYQKTLEVEEFPVNYNYILDYGNGHAEQEEFVRQRLQDQVPYNEFFGRSITVKEHPLLPMAFEAFPYTKKSRLFDDSFVASIFVKCDPNELENMYSDTEEKIKIKAEVTYANPYTVKNFRNTTFSISGQSTRLVPKLSYKISNLEDEKGKELYGRSSIKLRAEHMDPSLLREKLYGDILNTLGVPTAQNTYARLYINEKPIGLFDLSDNIKSNHYLKNAFNNGKKYDENKPNPLYSGNRDTEKGAYGNLGYYGDDGSQKEYSIYEYAGKDKSMTKQQHIQNELVPLFKEINAYESGSTNDLSIDVDSFLKYMAMEYLGGGIDNFWVSQSNFYLFKDLNKNKWYFHDTDFHYSFGVNWGENQMLNTPLSEFPPILEGEKEDKSRPFLDAIRSRPENEAKFKNIIIRLLKTSYHPNAVFPRLESITNLIREDAHWDVTLKKENPNASHGGQYTFTTNDFETEATSEQQKGFGGGFPVRYYVKSKALLTAKDLGIEMPYEYDSDLGFFENLSNAKKETNLEKSGTNEQITMSLFTILISIIFTLTIML